MSTVTLGGERLGSGNKNKVWMRDYERSNHDLSFIWKSTMSAGTLVPFLSLVGLPGDTFDVDLDADGLTHPTTGPLFGSYKMQLDIFQIPVRLYQGKLHMNMLGIGMDMKKVALPLIRVTGGVIDKKKSPDNQQVNASCLLSYLGIRGCGYNATSQNALVPRFFNAIPFLSYWSIYKQYYANKQEEIGVMIHKNINQVAPVITKYNLVEANPNIEVLAAASDYKLSQCNRQTRLVIKCTSGIFKGMNPSSFQIKLEWPNGEITSVTADKLFLNWTAYEATQELVGEAPNTQLFQQIGWGPISLTASVTDLADQEPQLVTFPLSNIDTMRQALLAHFQDAPYLINDQEIAPYGKILEYNGGNATGRQTAIQFNQEGLAVKTYNSDLFNNWIQTEWIDGPDGISAVTAVDTSDGSFTIDELNLSKKIYDMLMRISISGGTYDDWLDAVYTHDRTRSAEEPMYMGGLIQNLVFQEVVSSATTPDKPLGSLAGRGRIGNKRKGGKVVIKVDEPSYILGIVSLTPNVDYSQGNQWDVNLMTLDDLHKPALDQIGFQDLTTDQMHYLDTEVDPVEGLPKFKSAGKQPAWINYMTAVNQVRGNFADPLQQMYMVLNRRYDIEYGADAQATPRIGDLTTYIDPTKFNHIFANTRRDAQNFWVQIGCKIDARRKMSAKVIPNL